MSEQDLRDILNPPDAAERDRRAVENALKLLQHMTGERIYSSIGGIFLDRPSRPDVIAALRAAAERAEGAS